MAEGGVVSADDFKDCCDSCGHETDCLYDVPEGVAGRKEKQCFFCYRTHSSPERATIVSAIWALLEFLNKDPERK